MLIAKAHGANAWRLHEQRGVTLKTVDYSA